MRIYAYIVLVTCFIDLSSMNTCVHFYNFLCSAIELRWVAIGANTACDQLAGEIYRYQSSGRVANVEACQQSCEAEAECQSITYYNSGWCSHYSTACRAARVQNGATAFKKVAVLTTPGLDCRAY